MPLTLYHWLQQDSSPVLPSCHGPSRHQTVRHSRTQRYPVHGVCPPGWTRCTMRSSSFLKSLECPRASRAQKRQTRSCALGLPRPSERAVNRPPSHMKSGVGQLNLACVTVHPVGSRPLYMLSLYFLHIRMPFRREALGAEIRVSDSPQFKMIDLSGRPRNETAGDPPTPACTLIYNKLGQGGGLAR